MKLNTLCIYKGVGGGGKASPPEAEDIFKKSNEKEGFPFFLLLAGLPKSPKL